MKLTNIDNYFSDMDYLDNDFLNNNDVTVSFYNTLKIIKEKQNKGIIPIDEYIILSSEYDSIEYGYYMANIHYDLFDINIYKNSRLENRILFFLRHLDKDVFKERNFFIRGFDVCFRDYLCNIYNIDNKCECLREIVFKYGNDLEKDIYFLSWQLFYRDEYIGEHILACLGKNYVKEEYDIIDRLDFDSDNDFISFCNKVIAYRMDIIKHYSILEFDDCKESVLSELNKLKRIIIVCGTYNYDLEDKIVAILDYVNRERELYDKYGLGVIYDY